MITSGHDSISEYGDGDLGRAAHLEGLQRLTAYLDDTTRRLRTAGLASLFLTLLNLGFSLVAIVFSSRYFWTSAAEISISLAPITCALIAIGSLGFFEILRKRGDAAFQELINEQQRFVGREEDGDPDRGIVTFEARVAAREFAAAVDLPLVPGKYGAAAYVLLNITLAVATALTFRLG